MATSAAARPPPYRRGWGLRADERALVASAGGVFALAGAGTAMAAAAADGLFLAEVGRERLGVALAISSALLAVVLALAGAAADRLERRRVLGSLAFASAVLLGSLAVLVAAAPGAVAWTLYIGAKQLAAATDLAFWVAIAERVDARRSPRVLPLLAATGGAGATVGAVLVVPLADLAGTRGVLVAAALLLAAAGVGSAWLGGGNARALGWLGTRAARSTPRRFGGLAAVARAWQSGVSAARRNPLAAHLAVVVAIAGASGSLVYMALGFAVAAHGGDAGQLASLFGIVRAVAQGLTLIAQLALAPRLFAWLGTGRTLLVAPLVALASGLGLVAAPLLAVAVAVQVAARVLDAGIETPAEKVSLTLLPASVRGRVGGFLDGPAKRAGAVLGGVLAAALADVPLAFYASVAAFGALWVLAAARVSRELPALAIAHAAGEGGSAGPHDAAASSRFASSRAAAGALAADALAADALGSDRRGDGLAAGGLGTDMLAAGVLVADVLATDALAADVLAADALATDALAADALAADTDGPDDVLGAGGVVDARTIRALVRELAGGGTDRAAELLARLHARGRVDAIGPLVAAASRNGSVTTWRALVAALATPAPARGPAVLAAARGARADVRLLAVRAVGLAGGVSPAELVELRKQGELVELAEQLVTDIAALRLAGDRVELRAVLLEASRDLGPVGRVALEELVVELACALAAARATVRSPDDRVRSPDEDPFERLLVAARGVARSLARGAGDVAARASALAMLARAVRAKAGGGAAASGELALLRASLLELVRDRIDASASAPAPAHALVSLVRRRRSTVETATTAAPDTTSDAAPDNAADAAPEIAAAVRLLGALLATAATIEQDDLRRLSRALGEPDDDVRAAAEDAFARLGVAGTAELVETVAWGRRRARDRAAALLADLPVTAATFERLVDGELDALDQTATAIAVLGAPTGDTAASVLIVRRLEERLHEIAHTVLLLVAAQRRSRTIARAAAAWRHARGHHERARTLAVVEAALPRTLVRRLVDAVDELSPAERAAALEAAGRTLPPRDAAIRAELVGRDRLARALVLHALARDGNDAADYRGTIAEAARGEALAASPAELMKHLVRVAHADPEGAAEMPTRVETLIALGKVPLLAALTTRQLADVAERARWVTASARRVLASTGELIDALIVVADGELSLGDRRFAAGHVVDALACVAPIAADADLVATTTTRVVRLERIDFEELVDDVPGLAAAVCRALGERARRAEDAGYHSPFATRG
ncbi:MAG TPA: cyclic nucleotide-binding domain-containing protein [Kofleriaceae bacterium]